MDTINPIKCPICEKSELRSLKYSHISHQEVCARCWEQEQINLYISQHGVERISGGFVAATEKIEPLFNRTVSVGWQKKLTKD